MKYLGYDVCASTIRRAKRVPISAKLGTESRFWALSSIDRKESADDCFSQHLRYIKKVLLSTAFEGKMNFCTLLYGGFVKVVFPMLKMGHFRESIKKNDFLFHLKIHSLFLFAAD